MSMAGIGYGFIVISLLISALLDVVVLSDSLNHFRPEWVAMLIVYWVLRAPEKVGIFFAAFFGLFMDVLEGSYLGVHMLSLGVIAYLALSMHKRLKMFPLIQQAFVVFLLTGIHLMIIYGVRNLLDHAGNGLGFLTPALTSAIMWPVVVVLLDRLSRSWG